MKTIRITGKGHAQMSPNQIEISFDLNTLLPSYKDAVTTHGKKLETLESLLIKIGFDKKDLKTQDFDVAPRYRSVRDLKGDYKEKFEGYRVSQGLILKFDFDMELLDKVLSEVASSKVDPRIDVNFTIKEKEDFQNMLLESACKDAKQKAEILANACDKKILGIVDIDYSFSTINVYSKSRYNSSEMVCKEASIASHITPCDICESINVSFTFETE